MSSGRRVDLQSCADEPIHIPGSIQPHGFLLFFSLAGQLEGWSANPLRCSASNCSPAPPSTPSPCPLPRSNC
jgi:hypothetical protein